MQINKRLPKSKWGRLKRRHYRVRRKISGTPERPRLMVRKTSKHLYAMAIDDTTAKGSSTLLAASTHRKGVDPNKNCRNTTKAKELGTEVGNALKAKGITTIVFDRGGYRYHGVIKALADAIRETGIQV